MRQRWIVIAILLVACGSKHDTNNGNGDGGNHNEATPLPPDAFAGPWDDFPAMPIIDPSAPGTAGTLFGSPTTGAPSGGPCLVEPEVGTLYPNNWLRPRFSWVPTGSENLFEIRITTPHELQPLVVYTGAATWTMPLDVWTKLANHVVDQPITVAVRGATYDAGTMALTTGPELGSTGDIAIAPAAAPGAIVYWTTTGGTKLRGFKVGDETVRDIIKPADNPTQATLCVGCHSSTPDGAYVGFSASPQAGTGDPTELGLLSADGTATQPPFLTDSAKLLMARQNQEQPVFSKAHWRAGDHTAVTMYPINSRFEMIWTDLEATSQTEGTGWGVIVRVGDVVAGTTTPNAAAYASFAHTDDTLLYVSAPNVSSGVSTSHGNLATVPYTARAGGTYATVPGADTTTYNEYYPTFSPDDKFIAFNRVLDGQSSYNNAQAEVFVIPRAGGTPVSLRANAPPTCSGRTSPGVTNSWPKWAPGVTKVGAKSYYWVTFSSTRGTGNNPQLYVTPVVDDGTTLTTYPALYLWNQPAGENNHTPAWDNFDIIQ